MEAAKVLLLLIVGVMVAPQIQGQLSIQREGANVPNNSLIEIVNALSGPLPLQCSDSNGNVTWLILPDNGSLITYNGSTKGDNVYEISGSGSQVDLTIQNALGPFRGLLKCSSTSGSVLNIQVVPQDFQSANCTEETDSRWNIVWRTTYIDKRDYQPCPTDGSVQTLGYALRRCLSNGTWENTIDISGCSTERFEMLSAQAATLKAIVEDSELYASLSNILIGLGAATVPKSNNNTQFPRDLTISNEILETLLEVMENRASQQAVYTDVAVVINNLLHPSSIEGWLQLQMSNGSINLLRNIDRYGQFVMNYLTNSNTTGPDMDIREMYINFRVMSRMSAPYQAITYPANPDQGVQIEVPNSVLSGEQITGAVFVIMQGIENILPIPNLNSSVTTRVATNIISAQLFKTSGLLTTFIGDPIVFNFKTQTLRSRNPRCVFLDPSSTSAIGANWSTGGLFTVILGSSGAELKQFDVRCSSIHLTSFGVTVEETTTEFEFTIPVYIGLAFIIISSVISLFTVFLSCILDSFRKYFLSGYIIHMSFAASILIASIVFLAGIASALSNTASCQAVSGLLLYFYTASFSWLFCEALVLVFFGPISRNWCLFILIIITGWGLPAVSTAVTAGLLSNELGSTSQCWIYFDGNISSSVVLGFLIPKIVFVAGTFFLLTIGCCTTYKLTYKKIQPFVKKYIVRMLWFIWISSIILVALLSVSWVFLLLFVNAFATDLELSQWVFMGSSIILGIWMFLFNAIVVIMAQRVDYDRLWSKKEAVYVEADPGKGSGYEFMSMSSNMDLSGRRSNRSSIVVGPPTTFPQTENPTYI